MTQSYILSSNDEYIISSSRAFAMAAHKKISMKILALCCMALLFALTPAMSLKAQSDETIIDLAYHANASYPGSWSCAGNVYSIVANVTVVNSTNAEIPALTFTIPTGVTVQWEANVTPSFTTNPNLITLSGGGAVEVTSCTVSNTKGTGGVFNITGAGTTLTIGEGALVVSGRGGNPVLIAANDVTLNVNSGGEVQSDASNSNAALMIQDNRMNTVINVDGGSIISVSSGYAISDGAAFNDGANNDTKITISGGAVIAGTACAIRSAGKFSVVTVSGGIVSNAAGNNANPTIYMNSGLGNNVIVDGGTVQSSSAAGYAIQTVGNVQVNSGLVSAINGRAINLVGSNSVAEITGGTVQTTGTGTAISTATTNPETVTNASVVVTGGTVSSLSGNAINITGENSTVEVSGGTVSSTTGHTINAMGANSEITINGNAAVSATSGYAINTVTNATNAKVVVDGSAKVSSATSRAINTLSANSTVAINGNSQVWTFSTNSAVYSNGAVTLNGGFVFGYGTNANNVVHAATTPAVPSGSSTLVVAWNESIGRLSYAEGSNLHLSNAHTEETTNYSWHNIPPYRSGISYNYLGNLGFFHIPKVAVVNDVGLIFDAATGNMYYNINNIRSTSILVPADFAYPYDPDPTWDGEPGKLTLNGFSWSTGAATALIIVNGNATIELADNSVNYFASHPFSTATSIGISTDNEIAITGGGMLTASGSGSTSFGISCSALTIHSGTVEASGRQHALGNRTLSSPLQTYTLPATYTYWINKTDPVPPGGVESYYNTSPPVGAAFTIPPAYMPPPIRYVKIVSGPFALVDDETITGTVWSTLATQTATITLYGETMLNDLIGENVAGWFTNLPAGLRVVADAVEDEDEITLTFDGTPAETSNAPFDITIPESVLHGGANLHVIFNPAALFDITPYVPTIRPDTTGIFYVMETGTGDGSSWMNAYPNVADPLLLAARQYSGFITSVAANDTVREIWVAQGTYYPMHSANEYDMATKNFPENTLNNRDNAFVMVKDVQLYGGFPPDANDTDNAPASSSSTSSLTKEEALATRDWNANPTTLSGDIGTPGDNSDNCYHVVVSAGNAGTASLDGFVISGGNANNVNSMAYVNTETFNRGSGGGMSSANSSAMLTNVAISGNRAGAFGGGIHIADNSSAMLTNVAISGNVADNRGGGMYNRNSPAILTNVTISGNMATNNGGGIENYGSPSTIRNSIIWGNTATSGSNTGGFTSIYSYSLVEGVTDAGVILTDLDPLFVNPRPASEAPTTAGNYRLQPHSPCVNVGSNALFPAGITKDLGGNPRIMFGTIDLGAYESQTPLYTITVSANPDIDGFVSGGGIFAQGENVTLTANAGVCYSFVNWTEASAEVSTNASFTFPAERDVTLVANFVPKPFSGSGSGTAANPYIITTPEELDAIRCDLAAHYKLANDITLTDEWIPIGKIEWIDDDDYELHAFTGTLDGAGYSISGLKVVDVVFIGEDIQHYESAHYNGTYSAGLFAVLDRAVVCNLTLEAPIIEMEDLDDAVFTLGTIAGMSFGAQIREVTINNPKVLGDLENWTTLFLGGVVGYAYESEHPNSTGLSMHIINGAEVYEGEIRITKMEGGYVERSYGYLGGIAGANYNGVIVNTAVYGTEIGYNYNETRKIEALNVGGIVGYTSAEEPADRAFCVLNNISTAEINIAAGITADDYYVGGICGWLNEDAAVNNVYISEQSYDIFGQEDGTYTVSHNYKYANVPAANADNILNKLNDKTPNTGGFWVAAKVIADDTGYGFEESMSKLKCWVHETILGTAETPYFGACANYIITATAGPNGSITPSGDVEVKGGDNQKFTFTPAEHYHVDSVFVGGVFNAQAVADGFYTFVNVIKDDSIHVTFAKDSYIITATTVGKGTINPSGDVIVLYEADQEFIFAPAAKYKIAQVLIDGVNDEEAVANGNYIFTNVQTNHTITVVFVIDCPKDTADHEGNRYDVTTLVGMCWTFNIKAQTYSNGVAIPFAKAYNELENNAEDFGLLYTYESAYPSSGLTLCPEGWRLPTSAELLLLNAFPAEELKSEPFWLQPNNNNNNTFFDSRGAGSYNSNTNRFENLYGYTAYWSSDAPTNGMGTVASLTYYCMQVEIVEIKLTDAVSVRCVMED